MTMFGRDAAGGAAETFSNTADKISSNHEVKANKNVLMVFSKIPTLSQTIGFASSKVATAARKQTELLADS